MAEDFSKMSDAEIDKIIQRGPRKEAAGKGDFSNLSDEELDKIIANGRPPDSTSVSIMKGIDQADKPFVDREIPIIGGTPRGYALGMVDSLPIAGSVAGGAAGTPFGGPVGALAGGGLGFAIGKTAQNAIRPFVEGKDVPLMPQGTATETATNIVKGTAEPIVEGVTNEMGGQVIGKVVPAVASKIKETAGKWGTKLASNLTGISEKEIQTYATKADEVKQMIAQSDGSVHEAANEVRHKFMRDIDKTRKAASEEISKTLEHSNQRIDGNPILKKLQEAKGKIDPILYPEDIKSVDDLIGKISKKMSEDGTMSAQNGNVVKKFLQDKASASYKSPGTIFDIGTEAASAAKGAAAVARELVNEAEPAVAMANNKLAQLHAIEDTMNMNLIAPGKPEAALLAAGAKGNERSIQALTELGNLTGTNMVGEAEKLAAARSFNKPALFPTESTGKSLGKSLLLGMAGNSVGGPLLGAVGAASTSPMALKATLDTMRAAGKVAGPIVNSPATQGTANAVTRRMIQLQQEKRGGR